MQEGAVLHGQPHRGKPCDGYRRRRRHTRALRAVGRHIPQLRFPRGICGAAVQELHIPQRRSGHGIQRPEVLLASRPARPAQRQPHPGSAIPYHTPQRRGYRDSHNPCQPIRRGILFLCQRTAYHAGRHAPKRVQGGCEPHAQGILQPQFRVLRHSQRHGGCHRHTRAGPCVRVADKDQARLARDVAERRDHSQVHRRLHKERTRQLPASRARCGRGDTQKVQESERDRKAMSGVAKKPAKQPRK